MTEVVKRLSARERREVILTLIKQKGLKNLPSQRELAKKFGCSQMQIWKDIRKIAASFYTDPKVLELELDEQVGKELRDLDEIVELAKANKNLHLWMKARERQTEVLMQEIEARVKLGIVKEQPKVLEFAQPIKFIWNDPYASNKVEVSALPKAEPVSREQEEVPSSPDGDTGRKNDRLRE